MIMLENNYHAYLLELFPAKRESSWEASLVYGGGGDLVRFGMFTSSCLFGKYLLALSYVPM